MIDGVPNIMVARGLLEAKHFQILENLVKTVYPYRTKLSPKSVSIKPSHYADFGSLKRREWQWYGVQSLLLLS